MENQVMSEVTETPSKEFEDQVMSPFDSLKALTESHTELLRRELSAESANDPSFLKDVKELINRGRVTGALLEGVSERRTAQSLLNYWITILYRAGDTPTDAILFPYSEPQKFDPAAKYPYVGLHPFTEADHDRFYGRLGVTDRLIKRLGENRLVIFVGPAGSGKTSVVNAGVVPALKSGKQLAGSEQWHYFKTITPGREPLKTLAALLGSIDDTPAEVGAETESPFYDGKYLAQQLNLKLGEQRALIVVDRFEEIFTLCRNQKDQDAFVANLVNLTQDFEGSASRHSVIFIIRSDRTNYIIQRPDLKDLYPKAEIRIHALRESDLREVIKEPARKIGLKYETGVVAQLVQEVYGDQAGLPLLQFMLLKLWEQKQDDTITWAAMNKLGSCAYALIQTAESWYESLSDEQKGTARLVLLKMVRITDSLEVVGDRVRGEDLYQSSTTKEQINGMLESLLKANLVRLTKSAPLLAGQNAGAQQTQAVSPDDQFQLIHPTIWRDWEIFSDWIKELRAALVKRQRLESLAVNWVMLGRQDSGLLDQYQVHEARIWMMSPEAAQLGYDPNLTLLVEKSDEELKRKNRVKGRYVIALATTILIVFVILTAIASIVPRSLREATSRRLAEKANEIRKKQLDVALLLSLEAYRKDQSNTGARKSLMSSLAYSPRLRAFLQMRPKAAQLAFSPDGKRLSAVSVNGMTSLWDVKTLQRLDPEVKSPSSAKPEPYNYFLSPDGGHLLLMGRGKKIVLKSKRLDSNGSDEIITISEQESAYLVALAFSPDGKRLFWVSSTEKDNGGEKWDTQYKLTLWDLAERKEIQNALVKDEPQTIVCSPDGTSLAIVTSESDIVLRRVSDLNQVEKVIHGTTLPIDQLIFSGDGKMLAARDWAGELIVWSLNQPKLQPFKLSKATEQAGLPVKQVSAFALSETGEELVAGYDDGTVRFWNLATRVPRPFSGSYGSQVTNIVFRRGGEGVITTTGGADTESISLWNSMGQEVQIPTGRLGGIGRIALCADGRTLAAVSSDGAIILWDLQEEQLGIAVEAPQHGAIAVQTFTEDSTKILVRNLSDEISLFDVSSKELLKSFSITSKSTQFKKGVWQTADAVFSKNGRAVAVRSLDNIISVGDPLTGYFRPPLPAVGGDESAGEGGRIAISWDGTRLASTTASGIVFWDLNGYKQISKAQQGDVMCLAFNRDGTQVISGTREGRIGVWNVADGTQVRELESDPDLASGISSVGFSLDGSKLISITEDGALHVWDSAGNALSNRALNITSFALSYDGETLACVRDDGRITFWDLNAQEEIGTFSLGNKSPVVNLAYAPNGNILAAGHEDGSIQLVKLEIDFWRERACRIANRNLSPMEIKIYRILEDQAWKTKLEFWRSEDSFYSETCAGYSAGKD